MIKKTLRNEQGLSLVEVIAASVLLIIVLISFISFFITSKNTDVSSKNTVSATYTAQMEMENIYKKISTTTPDWTTMMTGFGYDTPTSPCINPTEQNYLKTLPNKKEIIITKLTKDKPSVGFVKILISVYDTKEVSLPTACTVTTKKPKSQMENIVKVGGS